MIELIEIGAFRKTTGNKGFIKLDINESIVPLIKNGSFLFVNRQGSRVPYKILKVNTHPSISVQLEDHLDPQKLNDFINQEVFLEKKSISVQVLEDITNSSQTIYEHLIGFRIYNANEHYLGIVKEVIDYGLHINLRVTLESGNRDIPFHDDLIVKLDEQEKIIVIDLVDGL